MSFSPRFRTGMGGGMGMGMRPSGMGSMGGGMGGGIMARQNIGESMAITSYDPRTELSDSQEPAQSDPQKSHASTSQEPALQGSLVEH